MSVPVLALLTLLLALFVGACAADSTSAREVFGDEALLSDDFPGMDEISLVWRDGKQGGTVVKPNYTSASRNLVAESGYSAESGFAELVEVAATSGWKEATGEDAGTDFFTANRTLPEGEAHLIINISPGPEPKVLVVSMTLDE